MSNLVWKSLDLHLVPDNFYNKRICIKELLKKSFQNHFILTKKPQKTQKVIFLFSRNTGSITIF